MGNLIHKLKIVRFDRKVTNLKVNINSRVVFSYLAYRAKLEKSATIAEISKQLRMKPEMIKTALDQLLDLTWIKKQGKWYTALELKPDLYYHRRNLEWEVHWTKKYTHWYLHIPNKNSGLTLVQSALYGWLENVCHETGQWKKSYQYVADSLGLSYDQVYNNLKKLAKLGLVQYEVDETCGIGQVKFTAKPLEKLNADQSSLFRSPRKTKRYNQLIIDNNYPADTIFKDIFAELVKGKFTEKRAHKVIEWCKQYTRIIDGLYENRYKQRAYAIHIKNNPDDTQGDISSLWWLEILKAVNKYAYWSKEEMNKWKAYR